MNTQIPYIYFGAIILVSVMACSIISSGETEPPAPATDLVTTDPTSTLESTSLSAQRDDGAHKIEIALDGSLQNPAWSPESTAFVFTRFTEGYNAEPADLFVVDLGSGETRVLVSDGSGNINLPGSTWNPVTHEIVFSSSRDPHDEIYVIDEEGVTGDETRVTDRADLVAYEPSLSPDGQWLVFESHVLDVEDNGVLTLYKIDGTQPYQTLTDPTEDSRQPNWSPVGDKILYQKFADGQWDIWTMNTDGTNHEKITSGVSDKTDASFSPDGQWIVYSSSELGLEHANLFVISASGGESTQITFFDGYDGAPSWSPDGDRIAFESYPGDPDGSSVTSLWVIDVPDSFKP